MPSDGNPYQPPKESTDAPLAVAPIDSNNSVVHFAGSLTVRDAYEAVNFAKTRLAILASLAGNTFLTILLVLATGFAVYQFSRDEDFLIPFIGMVVIDMVVVVTAIAHPRSVRRRADQLCREGQGLYAPTTGQVDGTGIESKADGAEAALTWNAFCAYRNSERVAILYRRFPSNYVIFACTKFRDEEDWQLFLTLVSGNLPAR